MSSKLKHKQRSQYRYHGYKPFGEFNFHAARIKEAKEFRKENGSLWERFKKVFQKTSNA